MDDAIHLSIVESSPVGESRRRAGDMARHAGLDETERGRVALVVTEVATNLLKHALNGELFLRTIECGDRRGLETISLDSGPGMADVETCLRDGYSTAGTPGTGLGAVTRLSSTFGIWSSATSGSALVARVVRGELPDNAESPLPRHDPVWPARERANGFADSMTLGAVCRALAGEPVCGDAWAICPSNTGWRLLVVDGLGHGLVAAEASRAAIRIFRESPQAGLTTMVDDIHRGIRHTRGAALALVELDPQEQEIRFVGVGNVAAVIVAYDATRSLMSHNGTVGHQMRKLQQFDYPWPTGSLLVVHTDGIKTRWSLDRYPGLLRKDPALTAAVLYRDFPRDHDDRTVIAIRAH